MEKGTITVAGGMVVLIRTRGESPLDVYTGQPLFDALKSLEREGWRVDGELPPFTTDGTYTIEIAKDESLPKVTGA